MERCIGPEEDSELLGYGTVTPPVFEGVEDECKKEDWLITVFPSLLNLIQHLSFHISDGMLIKMEVHAN